MVEDRLPEKNDGEQKQSLFIIHHTVQVCEKTATSCATL
jgi:hypothetical protein